jgi:hypothetical protein
MDSDELNVEAYKAYRGQIEAESTLVGVRLGWLIAAEAFLLAGYATILAIGPNGPAKFVNQARWLYRALPIAGSVLSALVGISIWAALWAMGQLKKSFADHHSAPSGFPKIAVGRLNYYAGSTAPFLVPPLTIAGWLILLRAGGR